MTDIIDTTITLMQHIETVKGHSDVHKKFYVTNELNKRYILTTREKQMISILIDTIISIDKRDIRISNPEYKRDDCCNLT